MIALINLVRAGGWMMLPILIASLVAVALVIEHTFTLGRARKSLNFLWDHPEKRDSLLVEKRTDVISQYLAESEEQRLVNLEEHEHLAGQLFLSQERRISWLGTIAAIAPLLGLLGTVSGMIQIFFRIAAAPPANPLADLSHGISEALVSTAGGLVVAIVAALGQHYLMNANDDLAMDLEAWLKEHGAGGKPLANAAK